jgi:putative transposase
MPVDVTRYPRYRFPPAILSHAVWLYYRFTLSFRDVEDLLAQRGILLSYESIRQWCETNLLDEGCTLRGERHGCAAGGNARPATKERMGKVLTTRREQDGANQPWVADFTHVATRSGTKSRDLRRCRR